MSNDINFTIDSHTAGLDCPCPPPCPPPFPPPFPPPPCPPPPCPPPRPVHYDDNLPYSPATYADVERVRCALHNETIERLKNDKILHERCDDLGEGLAELSGYVEKIVPGGGGVVVDEALSLTSKNPVQNKVLTERIFSDEAVLASVTSQVSTLSSGVGVLSANVSSLTVNVSGISTRVSSLSGIVGSLSTDVSALGVTVTGLSGTVETLSGGFSSISSTVVTLSSDVSVLGSNVDVLSSGVETLSTDIVSLSGTVGVLSVDVSTLGSSVDSLSGGVDSLSGNVISLSGVVGDLSGYVADVKDDVDRLNGAFDIADDKIKTLKDIESTKSIYVDECLTNTYNGEETNLVKGLGYHFKYLDVTHVEKDGCVDFYLAKGLWSYDALMDLWNDVHDPEKPEISLEDGHGVFDSTVVTEWDGIIEGTKRGFIYHTSASNEYVDVNRVLFFRNSTNYDGCLEMVKLVGNKLTCRIVRGTGMPIFSQVAYYDSPNYAKIVSGAMAPYEGGSSAWSEYYRDSDHISDMYSLRLTFNNIGGSIICRNQIALGYGNVTNGLSTTTVGCENMVSGKWGTAFGFGLRQLGWGENVYGRFNKFPTEPRPSGLMKYPVIIGAGLDESTRRDGLKFDRKGDAIFDGNIHSKSLGDIGIQSQRYKLLAKAAIPVYNTLADAIAKTNAISTPNFRRPKANDQASIMVIPSYHGIFWMSASSIRNAAGSVVYGPAAVAIRGTLKAGQTGITQSEFDNANFEEPHFAKGKFYCSSDKGLFWSEDGKEWARSSVVPDGVNELCHFHNSNAPKWYALKANDIVYWLKTLPAEGSPVTQAWTGSGSVISGVSVTKEGDSFFVTVGGVKNAATFALPRTWCEKLQDIFMLGDWLSFDPSTDEWFGGSTFLWPFLSVGAFIPVSAGAGNMTGFRGYCHGDSFGMRYSAFNFNDDGSVAFAWKNCGGIDLKGFSCDNLTAGRMSDGKYVVVISPLSGTIARPYYIENGGTAVQSTPWDYVGTPMETSFITDDGVVVVMPGTSEETGKGLLWTNKLNGSNTVWNRSNITSHAYTTPIFVETIGMYATTEYKREGELLVSVDGKFWKRSDVAANAFPPIGFAGKVILCGRGGTTSELFNVTFVAIDETYNFGSSGSGGSLAGVELIDTEDYDDRVIKNKINEIISKLGGNIPLITEPFTDDDIVERINLIITKHS